MQKCVSYWYSHKLELQFVIQLLKGLKPSFTCFWSKYAFTNYLNIYWVYQKKLDQNKMTINFCFIVDILFMNSFLFLMFFKEGLNWSFNHIISKYIFKWKKFIKNTLFEFRYHLKSKWINWKQQFYSDNDKF